MKTLNRFITERLKINKDTKVIHYKYHPKNKDELRKILKDRLAEDKNANLNDIDVSKITDMSSLFSYLDPHNIDISKWDVSDVRDMVNMFRDCENFDCDLGNWKVGMVENMSLMFLNCKKFKGRGLENWIVRYCENMKMMFKGCENLNCDLNSWEVRVEPLYLCFMFKDCKSLKKPKWYTKWDGIFKLE